MSIRVDSWLMAHVSVVVLLISRGRRRWPGSRSRTRSRRGWTDLENGSLVVSAAFCRHAIEPSVNEDHVVDRFSAIAIICFPAKAVKALVIITTGIHHEDSAPDHCRRRWQSSHRVGRPPGEERHRDFCRRDWFHQTYEVIRTMIPLLCVPPSNVVPYNRPFNGVIAS